MLSIVHSERDGITRYRRRTGRARTEPIVVERPQESAPRAAAVYYVTAGAIRGVLVEDGFDVALAAFAQA